MTEPTSDLQLQTLRLYGRLVALREQWGGEIVLCCGSGSALTGIPAAVSIAGGATLALDADAAKVKLAMKQGELDFVVNSLDEALRTLKNQVRQKLPLSVAVIADVRSVLDEMVARGVLPTLCMPSDYASLDAGAGRALAALTKAGMQALDAGESKRKSPFTEFYLTAANANELRKLDAKLLAVIPPGDAVRRRWVTQAPQYLKAARGGGRWVWLTRKERLEFSGR